MNPFRRAYLFLRSKYRLLSVKKYTTLAGTLVFFLVMSILPLTFWLTLIVGKLPVDTGRIFSLPVFASVKNVLGYVQKEAESATAGASIVLLITTLYSATNFFYQMRRSGELIYGYNRQRQGWKLRLGALALMFLVMLLVLAFVLIFGLGTFIFSRFLSKGAEVIADYLLLILLSFALVLLLNMYICPYKMPAGYFLPGTALTVGAWTVAVIGFALYLRVSNMEKLYGALSTVIVFLLWLYMLTVCFVSGAILNGEKIIKIRAHKKGKKKHSKVYEKV